MQGQRFGRWLVVGDQIIRRYGKHPAKYWPCQCDCGVKRDVAQQSLIEAKSISCGCRTVERATKHGLSRTAEYRVWQQMRARCSNPNHRKWSRYGGRGIKICERWADFSQFLEDMGKKPSPRHSINRIENDGDYDPKNCEWALPREQQANMSRNVFLEHGGEKLCVAEWARRTGINEQTITYRMRRSWAPQDVLRPTE